MLFPLSKSMSSTRLFQSGGQLSEPILRRQWSAATPGAEERMYEVHKLLTEKKPFEEHLRVAKNGADELRRKDIEFARAHTESIKDLQRRLDEQLKERQGEWVQGLAAARQRRAAGAADIMADLRQKQQDYQGARAEMEARVKTMPMLGGEPPAREGAERDAQRRTRMEAVKEKTKEYFQERRAMQQKLGERPMSMSKGQLRRDPADEIEERKVAKMAQASAAHREYESKVQALYDKHHGRVFVERKKREEDFQAHLDYRLAARDLAASRKAATQEKIKAEFAAREERLNDRTQTFGGYSPKAKSDRRMREEAALADLPGATRRPGLA